jgi:glycine oxidase
VILQDAMNVNPRELREILHGALKGLGVEMRTNESVQGLDIAGDACTGVLVKSGRIDANWVVVSAGSWSNTVLGELRIPDLSPTKGQVVLLRSRGGAVLRYPVSTSDELDMMPRPNGHLLIGTSNEEAGFDTSTTAVVLSGILNRALAVVPAVGDYEFVRAYAGLRPCTATRRPVIGPHPLCPNVIVSTGHCQNGVLMAPLTADTVVDLVHGRNHEGALITSMYPTLPPALSELG